MGMNKENEIRGMLGQPRGKANIFYPGPYSNHTETRQ